MSHQGDDDADLGNICSKLSSGSIPQRPPSSAAFPETSDEAACHPIVPVRAKVRWPMLSPWLGPGLSSPSHVPNRAAPCHHQDSPSISRKTNKSSPMMGSSNVDGGPLERWVSKKAFYCYLLLYVRVLLFLFGVNSLSLTMRDFALVCRLCKVEMRLNHCSGGW